jgi:uncharacterized protein YjbJ (UPF0337 family)
MHRRKPRRSAKKADTNKRTSQRPSNGRAIHRTTTPLSASRKTIMNSDTIIGQDKNFTGQIKEVAGKAIGDEQLQGAGIADQVSGTVQNAFGKARDFARQRPLAAAALGGVLGLALLNTLRGK